MKKLAILGLLGMAAATSCVTLEPVSYERLQPSELSFPETVRRVAVVNNAPAVTSPLDGNQITEWMDGDGRIAAEALAEGIASARYFDDVLLVDSAFSPQRFTAADADLLVSLERVVLHARRATLMDVDLLLPMDGVEIRVSPLVRLYLPGREAPLCTLAPVDSISWYLSAHPTDSLLRRESSEYAGQLPLSRMLPSWQAVERTVYGGASVELRDAAVLVREGQWDQAAAQWQTLYERKKGKLRRLSAWNLTVWAEQADRLPDALEWNQRYIDTTQEDSAERGAGEKYRIQLQERALALGKLNAQMERFDEKK